MCIVIVPSGWRSHGGPSAPRTPCNTECSYKSSSFNMFRAHYRCSCNIRDFRYSDRSYLVMLLLIKGRFPSCFIKPGSLWCCGKSVYDFTVHFHLVISPTFDHKRKHSQALTGLVPLRSRHFQGPSPHQHALPGSSIQSRHYPEAL